MANDPMVTFASATFTESVQSDDYAASFTDNAMTNDPTLSFAHNNDSESSEIGDMSNCDAGTEEHMTPDPFIKKPGLQIRRSDGKIYVNDSVWENMFPIKVTTLLYDIDGNSIYQLPFNKEDCFKNTKDGRPWGHTNRSNKSGFLGKRFMSNCKGGFVYLNSMCPHKNSALSINYNLHHVESVKVVEKKLCTKTVLPKGFTNLSIKFCNN